MYNKQKVTLICFPATRVDPDRRLERKDIHICAGAIGNGWEVFVQSYGLSEVEVQRISQDNVAMVVRVHAALEKIRQNMCPRLNEFLDRLASAEYLTVNFKAIMEQIEKGGGKLRLQEGVKKRKLFQIDII